ncbi:catalase [Ophiostoma piceae UAMH 11346]|uniref:Catalase n=1 Tax=Ophiostoma piceae (strain UAMH 11346) TaxID=1262450 RepID=S3BT99_OPHP1|nr:catalase [Ophiostoma piceae UAMH 11346]
MVTQHTFVIPNRDTQLIETLAHFARERIPEYVVHAKAAGAYGEFECTSDCTDITSASFLNTISKKINMLLRISTIGPERGSADTTRDVHGWAMKLYTDEGNLDWVFNNSTNKPDNNTVMSPEQAKSCKWNIFDMTKVWPHKDFPLRQVGRLTINRNVSRLYFTHTYITCPLTPMSLAKPRNYFADIEQVAFSLSNMVPGWAPSVDPTRYLLGVNYQQLPTNRPAVPVYCPFQRDGFMMNFSDNYGADPNYVGSTLQPTTFKTTRQGLTYSTLTEHEKWASQVSSFTGELSTQDFEQAAGLWGVLGRDPGHQDRFIGNVADNLRSVMYLKLRTMVYELFSRVDKDLGARLQKATESLLT